ncbi:MAG: 4-hydroxy-3-methylbut-2-enyl diphosphate reductase [Candidatus Peribacteraceae bacterium]|nr:4-hydroxy-3-methylbut-2-enyl diphosphate reductase [Candidatus Peribacteraceae bacterium]
MQVIRADHAGFCFGVQRAVELARSATKDSDRVATLGELIHNPEILEELNARGVRTIAAISKIHDGVIVIRAHGISQKKLTAIKKKKIKIIDASCPFVKKIHAEVAKLSVQKIPVVILGRRGHPEMRAVVEDFPGVEVVQKIALKRLQKFAGQQIGVLAQTTESPENFEKLLTALDQVGAKIISQNTICGATLDRQKAASKLARKVDAVVVVGGKKSNNTKKLFELANKIKPTFWIENESEIQKKDFVKFNKVGVTAGASTPEKTIERVCRTLKKL